MTPRYLTAILFLTVFTYANIIQATLIANEKPTRDFLILTETLYSGFGAELSAVLGALDAYEKGQYTGIEVDFRSGLFFEPTIGPNWWEYYFAAIHLGDIYSQNQHHSSTDESCSLSYTAYNILSRQQNYELIQKYVQVKPIIQETVDTFVKENFYNYFVIGVHHRGTDKVNEVLMVPWELTLQVLQHTIENLSQTNLERLKIYVATDDQHFLDYLLQIYPSYIVYGNFFRSTNDQPLHHYGSQYYSSYYEKGKEAIVEALILSRCDALIRPAPSGFSWIPMVFNPNMPVNSINCAGWRYPGKWSPALETAYRKE